MVYIGEVNGLPAYSPEDAEDVKVINGQKVLVLDAKGERAKRTTLQRGSQHLYFRNLATALNDAGWDMKATMEVLSKNAKIPWTETAIKEKLWVRSS